MSCSYIPSCAPSCFPSCGSPCGYPVGALGSLSSYGGLCGGGAASSSSLGVLSGANVSCVSQLPCSEVTVQPAPFCVTIPGAILSATCEPVRVGGYSACSGSSSLGYGRLSRRLCGYPC